MIEFLKNIYLSDEGATAVEYGLIVALIALGALAAITGVANETTNMRNEVATEVVENS